MIKFKEWKEFDIKVGEIKEVKENNIFVDVNSENLVICDKGNLNCNKGDKIVVLLENLEIGRILAAVKDKKVVLLKPDKKIENGARIE